MTDQGKPRTEMHGLSFKWEWSINTIAIFLGLLGGVAGGGYMLNEIQRSLDDHNEKIAEIRTEMKRVELADRRLENHEMRIDNVEGLARSAASVANELTSDVRLISEILQRLERSRGRHWRPEQPNEQP